MEYTLAMTFLTDAGLKTTLSISGVKSALTKDEVNALMDTVISKNIFETNSGDLVKKSGAQLTQRQVTKFDVA
ncbi:DUF2922 domain-containing protein [Clostridium saccharobutylicum]|uniref:DUF2922 domain-containing protein n=1 Tax=Clostridium saccharobutylicum DSM 13864 TaxID=1345695 RepID=U5MP72_CLOSA|nr:DUF2922 domain-containing protein [Clostridium saccharobutylicum]AGX41451.1 hypothetical protein CLSA_c04200 [Clostridium saccharobutylicum DSM 13864]AQR88732.1 hypothetical protein CLOSC_04090 [Clostridium saccharobutylicum]AQR98630.1 hypothetical protein CSACC_04150 [Clostridium saccharobutylicum]AQS12620.1 hypothetical protein CLOSACC_04150 [Clostridium saccharobutylicum]MBA2905638.1 hypothetical protein [Clostridium saccharobutylicum]